MRFNVARITPSRMLRLHGIQELFAQLTFCTFVTVVDTVNGGDTTMYSPTAWK